MASLAYTLLAHTLDSRAPKKNFREDCTIDTCSLKLSFWGYVPSLAANALFLALFAISTVLFIGQGIMYRRWLVFTIAMVCGCALEVIGYVGRMMAHKNPFKENPFLIQIVCLTIAPAFLAAGIYLCLSRIVITFGPENSRIKPLSYPRIFIPCDVVSLLLQAAGGAIASIATHKQKDPKIGNDLMLAGLSVQVITLFIFILLSLDFAFRTWKRIKSLGSEGALDPRHAALRNSFKFKGFLVMLALATMCIFTRSVYRVAELSEGWNGHLIKTQKYFIGLEGAIIALGVLVLNAFHPGVCFKGAFDADDGGSKCCGMGRKRKANVEAGTRSPEQMELVHETK